MHRHFVDPASNFMVVDEILQQLSGLRGEVDERLSFLLTRGVAGRAGVVRGFSAEEEWGMPMRQDWDEASLRRTSSDPVEPNAVVPPVVRSETVLYYNMLFSSRTRVPSEKLGQVFAALLDDPVWFDNVEQLPVMSMVNSIRDAAMDWWADYAKPALQTVTETYAQSSPEEAPTATNEEEEDPMSSAAATTRPDVRTLLPENWLLEMRSMLATFVALAAPYRAVRPSFAPVMYCSERVMMSGDPAVLYLSFLINLLPISPRNLAKNMPTLHAVAYGWGSSVTFGEILDARWQEYLALKAVFVQKQQALRARRRPPHAQAENEEEAAAAAAAEATHASAGTAARPTAPPSRFQGNPLHPAFLLPEDTIPASPRRFTSRRTSHVDPRLGTALPSSSTRTTAASATASEATSEAAQQTKQVLEVVLASMRRDVGDAGSCLWWARCRVLASLLLNTETMDELASSPAMPFFRHLAEVEPLAAQILADRAPWLQSADASPATGTTTSSSSAPPSRHATAQVTSSEELLSAQTACGQYGAAAASALVDMLVAANEDVKADEAGHVLRDWPAEDRAALQELRQLRGELTELYGELVGAIADVSIFYQTVNKTTSSTTSSLRAALGETGATGIWSTIHSTVPSNPRFARSSFTRYREFWQYQLLIDHHITHMVSLEAARACQLIVPQLVGTLQKYPDYYPVLILKTLMCTHRRDVLPAAVRAGLAPATVTVMRHFLTSLPTVHASAAPAAAPATETTTTTTTATVAAEAEWSEPSDSAEPAPALDQETDDADDAAASAAAAQVHHRTEAELSAQTAPLSHFDAPLCMSAYAALLFCLRTLKTLIKFGNHASVNPITLLLSPPTTATPSTAEAGAEGETAEALEADARNTLGDNNKDNIDTAAQTSPATPDVAPGAVVSMDPRRHDLCTVLLALAQQTRYGFLAGTALRLLASCVHSNVRDMVPALLERGIAQTLLDILARPATPSEYPTHTPESARRLVGTALPGILCSAEGTATGAHDLAACLTPFLPEEPLALRIHAPRMACVAIIQALTIHQVTHNIFLPSTTQWLSAIMESVRCGADAIRVMPHGTTTPAEAGPLRLAARLHAYEMQNSRPCLCTVAATTGEENETHDTALAAARRAQNDKADLYLFHFASTWTYLSPWLSSISKDVLQLFEECRAVRDKLGPAIRTSLLNVQGTVPDTTPPSNAPPAAFSAWLCGAATRAAPIAALDDMTALFAGFASFVFLLGRFLSSRDLQRRLGSDRNGLAAEAQSMMQAIAPGLAAPLMYLFYFAVPCRAGPTERAVNEEADTWQDAVVDTTLAVQSVNLSALSNLLGSVSDVVGKAVRSVLNLGFTNLHQSLQTQSKPHAHTPPRMGGVNASTTGESPNADTNADTNHIRPLHTPTFRLLPIAARFPAASPLNTQPSSRVVLAPADDAVLVALLSAIYSNRNYSGRVDEEFRSWFADMMLRLFLQLSPPHGAFPAFMSVAARRRPPSLTVAQRQQRRAPADSAAAAAEADAEMPSYPGVDDSVLRVTRLTGDIWLSSARHDTASSPSASPSASPSGGQAARTPSSTPSAGSTSSLPLRCRLAEEVRAGVRVLQAAAAARRRDAPHIENDDDDDDDVHRVGEEAEDVSLPMALRTSSEGFYCAMCRLLYAYTGERHHASLSSPMNASTDMMYRTQALERSPLHLNAMRLIEEIVVPVKRVRVFAEHYLKQQLGTEGQAAAAETGRDGSAAVASAGATPASSAPPLTMTPDALLPLLDVLDRSLDLEQAVRTLSALDYSNAARAISLVEPVRPRFSQLLTELELIIRIVYSCDLTGAMAGSDTAPSEALPSAPVPDTAAAAAALQQRVGLCLSQAVVSLLFITPVIRTSRSGASTNTVRLDACRLVSQLLSLALDVLPTLPGFPVVPAIHTGVMLHLKELTQEKNLAALVRDAAGGEPSIMGRGGILSFRETNNGLVRYADGSSSHGPNSTNDGSAIDYESGLPSALYATAETRNRVVLRAHSALASSGPSTDDDLAASPATASGAAASALSQRMQHGGRWRAPFSHRLAGGILTGEDDSFPWELRDPFVGTWSDMAATRHLEAVAGLRARQDAEEEEEEEDEDEQEEEEEDEEDDEGIHLDGLSPHADHVLGDDPAAEAMGAHFLESLRSLFASAEPLEEGWAHPHAPRARDENDSGSHEAAAEGLGEASDASADDEENAAPAPTETLRPTFLTVAPPTASASASALHPSRFSSQGERITQELLTGFQPPSPPPVGTLPTLAPEKMFFGHLLSWVCDLACGLVVPLEELSTADCQQHRRALARVIWSMWLVLPERTRGEVIASMVQLVLDDPVHRYPLLEYIGLLLSQRTTVRLRLALARTVLVSAVTTRVLRAVNTLKTTEEDAKRRVAASQETESPSSRPTRKRLLAALYHFALLFQDNDVASSAEETVRSNERCHHYVTGFCWNGRLCSRPHVLEEGSTLKTLRAAQLRAAVATDEAASSPADPHSPLAAVLHQGGNYLDTDRAAYEAILVRLDAHGYPSPALRCSERGATRPEGDTAEAPTSREGGARRAAGGAGDGRAQPSVLFANGETATAREARGSYAWRYRVPLPYRDLHIADAATTLLSASSSLPTPTPVPTEAPHGEDEPYPHTPSLATLVGAALTPHELLLDNDVCQALLASLLQLLCDPTEDGDREAVSASDKDADATGNAEPVPRLYRRSWRQEDNTVLVQEVASLAEMVAQLLRSLLFSDRHGCMAAIVQHRHARASQDVSIDVAATAAALAEQPTAQTSSGLQRSGGQRRTAPTALAGAGPALEETALPVVMAYLLQSSLCGGRGSGDSRFRNPNSAAAANTAATNNAAAAGGGGGSTDQRLFQSQTSGVAAVDALCLLVSDPHKEELVLHRHMLAAVHTIAQHAAVGCLTAEVRARFLHRHGLDTAASPPAPVHAHPHHAKPTHDAMPTGSSSSSTVVPLVSFMALLEPYRHSYVHAMRYLLESACEVVWVQDDTPAPLNAAAGELNASSAATTSDVNSLKIPPGAPTNAGTTADTVASSAGAPTEVDKNDKNAKMDRNGEDERSRRLGQSWVGIWVAPKLPPRANACTVSAGYQTGGSTISPEASATPASPLPDLGAASARSRAPSGRHVLEVLFLALTASMQSGRLTAAAATKLLDTCAEHPILLQSLTSTSTVLSVPPELRHVVTTTTTTTTSTTHSAPKEATSATASTTATGETEGVAVGDGSDVVASFTPIAVPAYVVIALRFRDQDHLPSSIFSALAHNSPQIFTYTLVSILWQTLRPLQSLVQGRAHSPAHLPRQYPDRDLCPEAAELCAQLRRVACTILHVIRKSMVLTTSTTFAATLGECYRRWGGLEALIVTGNCHCCTVPRDAATYLLLMRYLLMATSVHLKGADPAQLTMKTIEKERAALEQRLETASAFDVYLPKAPTKALSRHSSAPSPTALSTAAASSAIATRANGSAPASARTAAPTVSAASALAPTEVPPSLADALRHSQRMPFTDAASGAAEGLEPPGSLLTFTRPADVLLSQGDDLLMASGEPRLLTPTSATTLLPGRTGHSNRSGMLRTLLVGDDSDSDDAAEFIVEDFEEDEDDEDDAEEEEEDEEDGSEEPGDGAEETATDDSGNDANEAGEWEDVAEDEADDGEDEQEGSEESEEEDEEDEEDGELDYADMMFGDHGEPDAGDYGGDPGAFWMEDGSVPAHPVNWFSNFFNVVGGRRDPFGEAAHAFGLPFAAVDDAPVRSLGMIIQDAERGGGGLPMFGQAMRGGSGGGGGHEGSAYHSGLRTQTRQLALVCEALVTRLGPLQPDNTITVHLHLPVLRAEEEVAPRLCPSPSMRPSATATSPAAHSPVEAVSRRPHVEASSEQRAEPMPTRMMEDAESFRTPSQQRIAHSSSEPTSNEADLHATGAMTEPETTAPHGDEEDDRNAVMAHEVEVALPTNTNVTTAPATVPQTPESPPVAPAAEPAAVPPPPRTVEQRVLALFSTPPAPAALPTEGTAQATNADDAAPAAEEEAEEEAEVPEAEGPQPWEGVIDPLFLEPLPEDMRSEIVFNTMDRLRGPRTYTFEGRRTRIYRRFLTVLPADVLTFVLDVEARWLRITGNSNESTATAPGATAPGADAQATRTAELMAVLAVVDAEVRRDVLLTCNLDDLQSVPHLLAEAVELRRATEAEAERVRAEAARARAQRPEPGDPSIEARLRQMRRERDAIRAMARARGEDDGRGPALADASEEEPSASSSEDERYVGGAEAEGGGRREVGGRRPAHFTGASRSGPTWQPNWEPGVTPQNAYTTVTAAATSHGPSHFSTVDGHLLQLHHAALPLGVAGSAAERARQTAAAVASANRALVGRLSLGQGLTARQLYEFYASAEQLVGALDAARARVQRWRTAAMAPSTTTTATTTATSSAPPVSPPPPSLHAAAPPTAEENRHRMAAVPTFARWRMDPYSYDDHVYLPLSTPAAAVPAAVGASRHAAADPVTALGPWACRSLPANGEHPYHSFAPLLPRLPERTWRYCLSLLSIGMSMDDPATGSQLRAFRSVAYSNEKTRKQVQLLLRLACSTLPETAEMLSTVLGVLESFLLQMDREQQEAAVARSHSATPTAQDAAASTNIHDILTADTSYAAVEERQASQREQELFVCSLLNILVSLVEHNRNASLAFVMLPDEERYASPTGHPAPDRRAPLTSLETKSVEYRLLDRVTTIVSRTATVRAVLNDYTTLLQHLYKTLLTVTKVDEPSTDAHRDPIARTSEEIIETFPRHVHPLRWTDVSTEPSYQVGGYVCNVCGVNPSVTYCYHCATCHFDLCPSCARVRTSLEEDVIRLQRSMRNLLATKSMTDALLRMLHNPLCTETVAAALISLYSPGLGESATEHAKGGLGQRDPVVVQVEQALIGVAQSLIAEIRQKRAHTKQYIQRLCLEKMGPEAAAAAFAGGAGFGAGSYLLALPETFKLDVDETLVAIDHLNLRDNVKSMVQYLLIPYADCMRVEPREITRMWVAAQAYLEDMSLILARCTEDTHIPLPPCVVFLMSGFCQYHLRAARFLAQSTTHASFRSGSTLHGETERFLRETTRDPSELSAQASEAATQRTAVGALPRTAAEHGDAPVGAVTLAGGTHGGLFLSSVHPAASTAAAEGVISPDRLGAFGLLHLNIASAAPAPSGAGEAVGAAEGSGGTEGGALSPTPRARSTHATSQRVPRQVRAFLQNNRPTLNAVLHWEPGLLDASFSFLRTEPNLMDFEFKLKDFKQRLRRLLVTPGASGSLSLTVRRQNVLRDSFKELRSARQTRGQLHIRFQDEEGADAGGLTREWFQLMAEELVNASYGLFVHSREGLTFQPNPFSDVNPDHLSFFRFAGVVVGLAVMHNTSFDVHFTRAIYRHLIGVQPVFQDLESVDPELFANVNWLLGHEVTGLGLYFVVDFDHFGVTEEVELLPGGAEMMVTDANKQQYVRLLCEFHMTRRIEPQLREFLTGFYSVIPRSEISCFSEQEVELLICGMPDIDIEDLRAHTVYEGYNASSPQIRWFWEVVTAMTSTDRANLLQFVTGASKVPHGGFGSLQGTGGQRQAFTIGRWDAKNDLLPQAHTCFNKIDLPEYPDAATLREKVMTAITYGSMGFSMV